MNPWVSGNTQPPSCLPILLSSLLCGVLKWLSLAGVLWLTACNACSSRGAPLARLQQASGVVQRDFAAGQRDWRLAELGDAFEVGDGIQTLENASALLELDDDSQLSMDQETLIRFSNEAPGQNSTFEVEAGSAEIRVGLRPVLIQTPKGLARAAAQSKVRLTRSAEGLRFEVEVGRAYVDESTLQEGESVVFDADTGALELVQGAPDDAEPEAAEPAAAAGAIAATVAGKNASLLTENGYVPLPEGDRKLTAGSQLKLAGRTRIDLRRGRQRVSLLQNGEYIVAGEDGQFVTALSGSLSVGSSAAISVKVPGGSIVVGANSKALITREQGRSRVDVYVDHAEVRGTGSERLEAGQVGILSDEGEVEVQGRGLDHSDVTIGAGESVIIHDPSPPTAVRVDFEGTCEGAGRVEWRTRRGQERASGTGKVALPFGLGTTHYELSCVNADGSVSPVQKTGSVTVLRDAGTRAMPVKAPSTTIQADGRSYTVLYQNQLPRITLVWPKGPTQAPLKLVHASAGGTRTLSTTGPTHTFRSGSLREGKHVFHFEGSGKLSRQTTLFINFDNAASTAALNTQVTLDQKPGEQVAISGIALPGWDVSVGSQHAELDGQGRFSTRANLPTDERALAVRLSHPNRQTHIYLRRSHAP